MKRIDRKQYYPQLDPPPTIKERVYLHLMGEGRRRWQTRAQIAAALEISKSPGLLRALAELTADGLIERSEARTPQGNIVYIYRC